MKKSVKSWMPIKSIESGIVELKSGGFCKAVEIYPINFSLKSLSEQKGILYQYKSFLNVCNFDIQILFQSKRGNLDMHIENIEKNMKNEIGNMRELMKMYVDMVREETLKNAIKKQFFIIFYSKEKERERAIADLQEKSLKIKSAIVKCGNGFREFDNLNDELAEVIYTYMNPVTSEMQKMKRFDYEYKKSEKILNIGQNDLMDCVLPDSIDFSNPRYLVMDGMYFSGLIVTNYAVNQSIGWILPLFNLDFDVNISMFYEKLNSFKVIKELTYYIGDITGEIKTVNGNQRDIDVIKKSCEDAKYIRHQMQVEKENLYNLCIYVSVFSEKLEELKFNVERVESVCATMGLQTRKAIFRQEQILITMLPICKNPGDLRESSARNVLSSSLVSTYPFVSSELYDSEGVLVGENAQNNSLIVIDRFDSAKYKNPNMCVLGTSGSGKSFFVKLMLLRNRYFGISQFVIDPDGEYFKVCEKLGGTYIKLGGNDFVNIMDIRENAFSEDETKGYLVDKLSKLKIFFSLIFKNMSYREEVFLENKIIECYEQKGITFDDESLYKIPDNKVRRKKIFKTSADMPLLSDLYECLNRDEDTKELALQLKPYISGSLSFFNHYTNVDLDNVLIVADISKMDEKVVTIGMNLIIDMFWDRIKFNKSEKKIIYIDEAWKLIGSTGNVQTAEFVYKIFKTIRKYGGAGTVVTQNITDFFALENGKYGKAIINNSSLKFILQLEEEDVEILKGVVNMSEEEVLKVKNFDRGYGILFSNKNRVIAKVQANKAEYNLITTDRKDISANKNTKTQLPC